ncbi:TerB family tellurite resistance protein [Pseudomonadota bacterium]
MTTKDEGQDTPHTLQLATTALLFEMMRMDDEMHAQEHSVIKKSIQEKFELSASETAHLLELAQAEAEGATDYHQFTRLINNGFSMDQKVKVIEYLWQIAYADGDLDKYEEHLVRKIAELLYVPHQAFIATKHKAAQ